MTSKIIFSICVVFSFALILNQFETLSSNDLDLGRGQLISGGVFEIFENQKTNLASYTKRSIASTGNKNDANNNDDSDNYEKAERQLKSEKTIADSLGGSTVKSIIGQNAEPIDQLIYGTLFGRYSYVLEKDGKLNSLRFSKGLIPDMAVVVENRKSLILEYSSLFVNGVLSVELSENNSKEKEIVYDLKGLKGALLAKVKFSLDKDGRLLRLEKSLN